jgi:hypothetical protein
LRRHWKRVADWSKKSLHPRADPGRLRVRSVGDGAEAGAGDEAVDDVGDGVAVGGVEFGDGGVAVFEAAGGGVEWSAGGVVEDELVEAGVEGFGDAGERVE